MVVINGAPRNWIVLFAAGALLFNAANGVATGSAIMFYRTVRRSEDPGLYWFAVVLSVVLGLGGILTLVI